MSLRQWGRYLLPDGTLVEASQITSEPRRWQLYGEARPDAPLYIEDERQAGRFFYVGPTAEPGIWSITPSDLTVEDLREAE